MTHARYVTFHMAEVAISQQLFSTILRRISRLGPVSVTRANMTISASAKRGIAQDRMERCVGTRVKNAEVASGGWY